MIDLLILEPALAEIFLAGISLILVLIAAFIPHRRLATLIVCRTVIISLLIALWLVVYNGNQPAYAFYGQFFTSPFMVYMKILLILGAVGVLLMGRRSTRDDEIERPELHILMLLAVLGMMLMVSANDLIVLYMGLELQSLPLYIIAAIRRDSMRSSEAGLKYFLLGALASGLLLYGISLIYGFTGSLSYDGIKLAVDAANTNGIGIGTGAVIGIVFLLCGLAFKISAAPFHMWTPDVYEGSPTLVTAFFAVVPKLAIMTLFIRFTYGVLGDVTSSWQQVVVALAALSMVVGAIGALRQTNIKRLMAYSSIAHMGYALVGLSSALAVGVSSVMVYMVIYVISSVGVFALILSLRRDGRPAERISDLAGFSTSHPMYAMALLVLMFSMAGIPPLGGFFGKWFVFSAAVDAGFVPLAVIGVLSSVVGAFYYLRIVKIMYIDGVEDKLDGTIPFSNRVIATASAGVLLLFAFVIAFLRDTIAATLPFIVFVAG